ncbi:MAG: hypothetical protein HY752_00425 [Nitrospirae bacterium]|nr:hypothetical protein [Nitrospirota bacterium]
MKPFNVAIYLLINILLFSSWYIFLFNKRHFLSFIDRLIGAFILGLTQIVVTEMLLGILFKGLYAMPLFILNISVSSLVLIFVFIQSGQPFVLLRDILKEVKNELNRFLSIIRGDGILLFLFGLFLISILWLIFLGYLFPSYTWDALWYHLPSMGRIIQSGAIQDSPPFLFIDVVLNALPKNIELFFLWNVIFLRNDVIVDLSQLPFTIVGVLTIYSIAIKAGIKEKYAIYSSLLFFFTPIIILQSTTNYADVAVAVLFLIAINFLVSHLSLRVPTFRDEAISSEIFLPSRSIGRHQNDRKQRARNDRIPILLAGLSAGILLGSKGSGLLFVVVLSLMVIIQEFIKCKKPINIISSGYKEYIVNPVRNRVSNGVKETFMTYAVYFIVPVFLTGGYWYMKNWVIYNNPLYPIDISYLNIIVFKGQFKGIIEPVHDVISNLSPLGKLFYVWMERVEYYLYDSRLSGFGPIWFILFLPSIVTAFFYAVKRKGFLFVSLILIVTFLIYPRSWNTRYVIFIIGLGAVSFGLMLECFDKRGRELKIIALLLVVYTFLSANSPAIMPVKIKEFFHLPAKERTIARHAPFNIDLHVRKEYGYWIWISKNITKGDVLAFTFEPLFLSPLWNREFSNKIVYIVSDTYNDWIKRLRESKVSYVLIKTNSVENKWIEKEKKVLLSFYWIGHKERFKVVYFDENYKILRFIE